MNKLITALIGVGLLALSGNAAAIMIQGKQVDNLDDVRMLLSAYTPDGKKQIKNLSKAGKIVEKVEAAMNKNKSAKKVGKKERKAEKRLAKLALNLSLLAQAAPLEVEIEPKPPGIGEPEPGPGPDAGPGPGEPGDAESIPEPSIIALLGLGLIGIGAVRRFKKTA